ncbi:MAG: Kdo domain containing protein [Flavobacteriales bacterium]|nr:Kdo domain containing protein [Flavobacteriales bacterium]
MNHKYILNEDFTSFKDFLLSIASSFTKNTQSIHKARNELKIINYNAIDTIVKSFQVPNILRKIIYTFFRDSKAKKSYEYSLKIAEFTPKPIGYIEFYKNSLIDESYFISEKFDYDFTIREPLVDENFENREEIFQSFARFTYALHQNNILHQDYSPGNILIKKEVDDYLFKIVDINRMEFRELSLDERLKNFNKLWAKDDELKIIVEEYANISNEDKNYCIQTALKYNTNHKNKINMKKRLKGIKVVD